MSATPAPPAAAGPSDLVRSVVSFLLFLHLFAIGVAVLSRANAAVPAPLEARLRQVPGVEPYIALTGLDWPYTYFLMLSPLGRGRPDWDHRIEIDLQLADGKRETHVLPDRATMTGPRLHRYERLVDNAVSMLEATSMESRIPEGIARAFVTSRKATGGTIRIRGKTAPDEAYQSMPKEYPPTPMYEARILVAGGTVSLFKIDSATDSAPASGARPAPAAPTTQGPPTAPPATGS